MTEVICSCTFLFSGGLWYGVDINNEDIADNFEACVWEPAVVKTNAITAATEAACLILSVDETVKNPKSGADGPPPGGMGRGRGRPRWAEGLVAQDERRRQWLICVERCCLVRHDNSYNAAVLQNTVKNNERIKQSYNSQSG